MAPLLSILGNLALLRFHATWDNNIKGTLGALKITFTTLLKTLDSRNRANEDIDELAFTVHEIYQQGRFSTHLQCLSLDFCPYKIYDEVEQHCRNIQQLIISSWHTRFNSDL